MIWLFIKFFNVDIALCGIDLCNTINIHIKKIVDNAEKI